MLRPRDPDGFCAPCLRSTAPVRNASRYRSLLEASLPDIFESLQVCAAGLHERCGRARAPCLYLSAGPCQSARSARAALHAERGLPGGCYAGRACYQDRVSIRVLYPIVRVLYVRSRPGAPQETYRSVDGRMAQEALRRHVLRLLRVWRSWFIFADDFLNGLQARAAPPRACARVQATSQRGAAAVIIVHHHCVDICEQSCCSCRRAALAKEERDTDTGF